MSDKASYIMIGGFLGAGKTTAILELAGRLHDRGLRVGLITNDQSFGLVDTALVQARGFAVEEITGGCFCCRFNSLVEASQRLSRNERPDVFIAEPVGSCTDLVATVSYPLRRMYGDDFRIAPLSVLIDPLRALRILGVESGAAFSDKVLYVYRKQLEEARIIVVNKADLISQERARGLQDALASQFPQAEQFVVSARAHTGLDPWFERITGSEHGVERPPDVDYDLYAEGEALLGWLNCTVRLEGDRPFDGNAFLLELARSIGGRLDQLGLEVAHLKMTLTPDEGRDIAVCNLVRRDGRPEQSHTLSEPLDGGRLILNLRAEGDPDDLHRAALESLDACASRLAGLRREVEHVEHFRPARPVPTYRIV